MHDFLRRRFLPTFGAALAMLVCIPLAAADTDKDLADRIAAAGDSAKYPGAACVVVFDDSEVLVRPSGLATTDQLRVLKILTDKGIREQAVQTFDFDPVTNRFQVKRIRVHRANGNVESVDLSRIVTALAPQWGIYWGQMFQTIALPRLAVGDCIEFATTRTGFNLAYLNGDTAGPIVGAENLEPPMKGHWHDTAYFQESYPIIEKRFTVRAPTNKPMQYEICHGQVQTTVRFEGDQTVYTFVAKDADVVPSEPHREAFSDVACKLVITSVTDWIAKSRWFHDANVKQFDVTPEIQAKTDEIIAGITNDVEKIRAINCWVADNIRYVGTSRGVCEGYTMHTGDETFRDRGGVCKDKAGMAVTMLRAAGFDSYPVMTQAGSDVEYTPADQFNHAVTVVRKPDGSLMLVDPTWSPLSREIWSSRESNQYVVYGLPEGHDLGQSPYFPPEHNMASCEARSRIESNGQLVSDMKFDLTGYPDTYYRRGLGRASPRDQRGLIEQWFARLGDRASLVTISRPDIYDYSKDATITATVQADGHAVGNSSTRMFHLPMLRHPLGDMVAPDVLEKAKKNDDRKFGMRMRATRLLRYTDTLELPPEWSVEDLPEDVDIDNDAARLAFKSRVNGNTVEYSLEVVVKHQIIPADDYAGYYEVNSKMLELADAWVVCRANGDKGAPIASADGGAKEVTR